jgi:hypothetical protein
VSFHCTFYTCIASNLIRRFSFRNRQNSEISSVGCDAFVNKVAFVSKVAFGMKLLSGIVLVVCLSSVCSMKIDCEFKIYGWKYIGSAYLCYSSAINTGSPTIIEELHGTHLSGKTNADVLGFWDKGRQMQYIPSNLATFFPNLKAIAFDAPLLQVISSDLKPFPNLVWFYSSGCQFTSIEGDLFQHTKKLQEIEFHDGKLESVGDNLLSGLNELEVANFESNTCISSYAKTPEEMEELKEKLSALCPSKKEQNVQL